LCSRLAFALVPLLFAGISSGTSVSTNTGSLGAAANGTNATAVTFGPGAVTAGGDLAAIYNNTNGVNTTVPFLSALNPAAGSPFTIEFWAKPASNDSDSAPVANRISSGNRSGWVFFERGNDPANPSATPGWNFRMYNGNGSGLGWDITGGNAPLNAWSQVVATWDGSAAKLYENGALVASTNSGTATGVYNPNTTGPLTVGTLEDQTSPFDGSVDEVAFYGSALSATTILNHFNAISSPTAGAYQSLVQSDGALLQLSNGAVPEPSAMLLLGGSLILVRRRLSR
jgi:hypothetical protein